MHVQDVIQINDQWYVLATSSRTDDRTRVLKHGDTFGVFDRYGDIQPIGLGEQGLYHDGTRFLSRMELNVSQRRPLLLNSSVKSDNSLLQVDLTTPDLYRDGELYIAKGTVHLFRAKILWEGSYYEHLRIVNYGARTVQLELELMMDSDFADIFEVRGIKRPRRGERLPPELKENRLTVSYRGLDNVVRRSIAGFDPAPARLEPGRAIYTLALTPGDAQNIYVNVACAYEGQPRASVGYTEVLRLSSRVVRSGRAVVGSLHTSSEQFNEWVGRSAADLAMLTSETDHGPYPYAGVPWFSTPFGRDGIITALQYLWLDPSLARGVLGFLAATQATTQNSAQDAEPGKILHEMRKGEMPALGEVPFERYYGTVDATPLFVVLAEAYYQRTADRAFLGELWPHVERALHWIDHYGDMDGDGFVEYARRSDNGLVQQGWKDSDDSVFHADGSDARHPIALCEVQGYVYRAKLAASVMAGALGDTERATALRAQAAQLKRRFNEAFWCEEIGSFALALDGEKHPCVVRSSNAGHALWCGIADEALAARLATTLLSPPSFSGWGVRTIAKGEPRFNPMAYHNGSIWPHDNAIIAAGLADYGFKTEANRILTGLFEAALEFDLNRLPELFCGFDRLPGQGPTLYPVACSPQAWAGGAVFHLLQAALGVTFSAERPQITFRHPQLPHYLQRVEVRNLRFGEATVDLGFRRHTQDVGINVLRKDGDIEIVVVM